MYEEMRNLADSFCEEAFDTWNACSFADQSTAAEFIVKVAEMMLLQAHLWNPEEDE